MSMATLLEPFGGGLKCDDPSRNVFDIHGGGIDLVFPHHENEIAQSCCAFGSKRMANVWMHNGFLQVEGEKMSKSLGNFVTIQELLHTTKFGGRKWPGEALRLAMLRTHYRQPIDWTVKALEEAEATLDGWYRRGRTDVEDERRPATRACSTRLSDDLNTPAAIVARSVIEPAGANPAAARSSLPSFGQPNRLADLETCAIDARSAAASRRDSRRTWSRLRGQISDGSCGHNARIAGWISSRTESRRLSRRARRGKNWAESDRLRDELAALGVAIKDNKDGTTTWEPKR